MEFVVSWDFGQGKPCGVEWKVGGASAGLLGGSATHRVLSFFCPDGLSADSWRDLSVCPSGGCPPLPRSTVGGGSQARDLPLCGPPSRPLADFLLPPESHEKFCAPLHPIQPVEAPAADCRVSEPGPRETRTACGSCPPIASGSPDRPTPLSAGPGAPRGSRDSGTSRASARIFPDP